MGWGSWVVGERGSLHAPQRRGGLPAGGVVADLLASIIWVVQHVQGRKHIEQAALPEP